MDVSSIQHPSIPHHIFTRNLCFILLCIT